MAGIIDKKSRIFDVILTEEGKRQMANGRLRLKFYSFSDAGTFYSQDTIVSGGLDATYRISLEASNSPSDRVSLESDDAGHLTGFLRSGSQSYAVKTGQVFSGSNDSLQAKQVVSGAQFSSLSEKLLKTSIKNFRNLYILQSPDPIDDENKKFLVGPLTSSFSITNDNPVIKDSIKTIDIDDEEEFFFDKRLSHIPNFQFLPPKNKKRTGEQEATSLGDYENLNQESILSIEQLRQELQKLDRNGYKQTINFYETTELNNIMGQFFEVGEKNLTKLDVIDFGDFPSEGGTAHVFFVGKIYADNLGRYKFMNLFTLIFDNQP